MNRLEGRLNRGVEDGIKIFARSYRGSRTDVQRAEADEIAESFINSMTGDEFERAQYKRKYLVLTGRKPKSSPSTRYIRDVAHS